MSYTTNLAASQQESMPEMFLLTSGSQIERYTSYQSSVTFLGQTFKAGAIKRSSLSYDSTFGSVGVKITAQLIDTFSQYVANQPITPTRIKIYRAISSDLTDYVVLFSGQVKEVTIAGNKAQATCESKSLYLSKRLPTIIYQAYCNHDVFDAGCGLNANSWKVTGSLTGVSGSTITSSSWSNAAGYEDGYWTGGRVVVGSDMRLVIDHTDDTLTLQIPFGSSVITGTSVDAYPGCDGSPQVCKNKFDNLDKFLGMPYIPSRNPVIWGFK